MTFTDLTAFCHLVTLTDLLTWQSWLFVDLAVTDLTAMASFMTTVLLVIVYLSRHSCKFGGGGGGG